MILHNFSEIPELKLKRIDPSKNMSDLVEIFNYNMNQIYQWWKDKYYESQLENDKEEPVVIHGINVKGDRGLAGSKGNSIFFVNDPISNGQTVTDELYKKGDYVISNSSIYAVVEGSLEGQLIYEFIGTMSSSFFALPTENISPTSHALVDWNQPSNAYTSVLSPYKLVENGIQYYSIQIGDYKKTNFLNSSLTLTNILENKNDGSNTLPTDAMDSTSRNFAQLILQYRKSNTQDPIPNVGIHKLYVGKNPRYNVLIDPNAPINLIEDPIIYDISNGNAMISLRSNYSVNKTMLYNMNQVFQQDMVSLGSNNIGFFKTGNEIVFYHDSLGDNYYMHKDITSGNVSNAYRITPPSLTLGFVVHATGGLVTNSISSTKETIVKKGVLQDSGFGLIYVPLIWKNIAGYNDLALNYSTDKVKNVDIMEKSNYLVYGYVSEHERSLLQGNTSTFDEELMLKAMYNRVINDGGLYKMETDYGINYAGIEQDRARLNLVIKDLPNNREYGKKKVIYVKSFGYHKRVGGLMGYSVTLPISIYDEARSKYLRIYYGFNISPNIKGSIIAGVQDKYPTGRITYTTDNTYDASGFMLRVSDSRLAILPRGANSSTGTPNGSDVIINLNMTSAIFRIELAFFGYGWEIVSITPSTF